MKIINKKNLLLTIFVGVFFALTNTVNAGDKACNDETDCKSICADGAFYTVTTPVNTYYCTKGYKTDSATGGTTSSSPNLIYSPMETLPGFDKTADFATFISNLYKFGIWVVGICALIMIVIGGYMYAASGGNNASMEKAKTYITDAIAGLILALLAYLILYIINPKLIEINMGGVSTAVTSATGKEAATNLSANTNVTYTTATSGDCKDASGTTVSPTSSLSQSSAGSCSTTCNSTCKSGTPCSGCVSISTKLLDAVNTVGTTNSLSVSSFTGGEHVAGSDHYSGTAADVVPSADKSEWDSVVSQFNSAGCSAYCDNGSTTDSKKVSCSGSTASHIHVSGC